MNTIGTCLLDRAPYSVGGVGKTQIALECAFQLQKILPMLSVFWVRANDVTSFDNAFRDIGQQLKIPGLEDDKADIKRLVKTRSLPPSLSIMQTGSDFKGPTTVSGGTVFQGNYARFEHGYVGRKSAVINVLNAEKQPALQ
jgi:hypothetical protein